MELDLILLGLVLLLAVAGALSGVARQVAWLASMVLAFIGARPLGALLAPHLSKAVGVPLLLGTVLAALFAFVCVLLVTRSLLTYALRKLLAGRAEDDRSIDRTLGFFLGGLTAASIAYVAVCALSFVETNVAIAGGRLGISPKDSVAFALARRFNVFEMAQLEAARDLVRVAKGLEEPATAKKLKADPAYLALKKDPRFQGALSGEAMRSAILAGDHRALMQSDPVLRLLQDPEAAARLRKLAEALTGTGAPP